MRSYGTSRTDARNMVEDAVSGYESRLDALELACAGLWDLLKTKHGYTDEELVAAIHTVDARDGVADGKVTPITAECPRCHRKPLIRNPKKCAWCGEPIAARGF